MRDRLPTSGQGPGIKAAGVLVRPPADRAAERPRGMERLKAWEEQGGSEARFRQKPRLPRFLAQTSAGRLCRRRAATGPKVGQRRSDSGRKNMRHADSEACGISRQPPQREVFDTLLLVLKVDKARADCAVTPSLPAELGPWSEPGDVPVRRCADDMPARISSVKGTKMCLPAEATIVGHTSKGLTSGVQTVPSAGKVRFTR
jgi:hypothetical protein